jgi:hypothetical protein
MCKSLLAVEALSLEAPVAQHLRHLRILLPVLTEDELALVVVVLVLPTPPVLSTLSLVLQAPRSESDREIAKRGQIAPSALCEGALLALEERTREDGAETRARAAKKRLKEAQAPRCDRVAMHRVLCQPDTSCR